MKSIKPGKQRKRLYNAPLHKKRKWVAAHLTENLLLKYDHRSASVVKGDTVKVMRGSFKGHEDKVASVNIRKQVVEIEGITTVKADGTKIAKPMHASNLLITKLNLTDKWRRKKLEKGLSETTKKEIEKEAEEQIKELEEEKKMAEEIIEAEEKEEAEEIPEETSKIPEKKEKKPKEKEGPKEGKKEEKKSEQVTKKKTVEKKDKPPKKKVAKKTPAKTTKKEEGGKNE
ncbi:MAG: 50S ribosomal protein L24 [Thermoplasmatales archaeon]|nr:MAG: 50S ribosomal protein L24 [Thermoplasmatales archaeon]